VRARAAHRRDRCRQARITADTDLRLCRFFGLSDGWWLRLQADYDTEVAKAGLAKTLAKIRPWKEAMEETADAH
jgi:plasmid maintenance system antidote protein VapI